MTLRKPRFRAIGLLGVALTSIAFTAVFLSKGCSDRPDPLPCGPEGCNDADVAGGDGDGDGDADTDTGNDDSGDDAGTDAMAECASEADCVLAINYRACCACPEALPTDRIEEDACVLEASGSPQRPEGCLAFPDACHPDSCDPCPEPVGVSCVGGRCIERFDGECTIDEDCGTGRLCRVIDGQARCIDDPSSCRTTADCDREGWECRDWRENGVRFCWNPASNCFDDMSCYFSEFCEDPDGDGIYRCARHEGACVVEREECGELDCVDPDGDGRGVCE